MPKLKMLKPKLKMLETRIGYRNQPTGLSADQAYDRRRSSLSATRRLYGTAQWKRQAAAQLREEPICRMCLGDGVVESATHCDHIIPHRGNVDAFWAGPFQSLCGPCHNSRKQREERAEYASSRPWSDEVSERRMPTDLKPSRIPLTIVTGPPGSGKSTYIRERMGPGDLLIDLDRIMAGLSGLPEHHTASQWLGPALEQRNRLLRSLAEDRTHDRAWFIVGAPDPIERQLWHRRLGGELVTLDVPLAECIRRIRADPTREGQTDRMERTAAMWWAANSPRQDRGGRLG